MRLRDAESGVYQERRTHSVSSGSRYRKRGAVLEVIAGARRREAARSTQERAVNRLLNVVVRLVAPAAGKPELIRGDVVEPRVHLVEIVNCTLIYVIVID